MATYKKTRVKIPELVKGDIIQLGEHSHERFQVVEVNTGTQIKVKNIVTKKAHNQFGTCRIYRIDEKNVSYIPTDNEQNQQFNPLNHEQTK